MSTPLHEAIDLARRAVAAASHLCLDVLADRSDDLAMEKAGAEPVTIADYGSQAVLLHHLRSTRPDECVIAEEGADHLLREAGSDGLATIVRLAELHTGADADIDTVCAWIDHSGSGGRYTWAIDPIDGTKGFLRGDQFAVAVGILEEGQVVGGVLGCPHLELGGHRGVVVWAGRGLGAHVEPLSGSGSQSIRVDESAGPESARMVGSVESAHGDPALVGAIVDGAGLGGGWVRLDSQVKYVAVAAGLADVYVRPRNRPEYRERIWDHAAGAAVVTEAGGRVTDLDGRDLDFSLGSRLEENRGVVATNGVVHDLVLSAAAAAERSAD